MSRRNADYGAADLVLALLYAIMACLRRSNKREILQYNGTFLSLLGLSRFPDQSTQRRFLKGMSPRSVRPLVTLHDQLRAQLFPLPRRRTTLTFDLDSVVLTVYGKQQFARVGYNPKKRGRRSYPPLVCFEAHLQEFWHGSLRPGHTVTGTGLVAFVQRCLDKVPSSIAWSRVRVRGDSGCFGKRLVEFLDTRGCGYTVVAKEYSPIKRSAAIANSGSWGRGGRWESSVINPITGSAPTALWWYVVPFPRIRSKPGN
jgi:hypothetical protein